MSNLENILKLDFSYFETFTIRVDTAWGSMFCNENNPTYYDANHAHVSIPAVNPNRIIDEVISFYTAKKITPRFYIYNLDRQQALIHELELLQFGFEKLISPVQLWNKSLTIRSEQNERVQIEEVSGVNFEEALHIECSIKEFGGESREKAFREEFDHPAFTHYLLRYDSVACSTACIFEDGNQARMESVATLESYRGRGLIGELINHIQLEVLNRGLDNLWVFPINEAIEKVYQKYGFDTVAKFEMAHAFLGGKSITEIREG